MLKDIAPKARPRTTRNARHLRRKMTLPEVILWHWLRQRPRGSNSGDSIRLVRMCWTSFAAMRDWRSKWMEKCIRGVIGRSGMQRGMNG